mmetsp:Transcript_43234/g.133551  ORF Transcript_43234/g.133551 Transcript_43234/m.133551 type:complete len:306 (-) Transcript_43234:34-951(-)
MRDASWPRSLVAECFFRGTHEWEETTIVRYGGVASCRRSPKEEEEGARSSSGPSKRSSGLSKRQILGSSDHIVAESEPLISHVWQAHGVSFADSAQRRNPEKKTKKREAERSKKNSKAPRRTTYSSVRVQQGIANQRSLVARTVRFGKIVALGWDALSRWFCYVCFGGDCWKRAQHCMVFRAVPRSGGRARRRDQYGADAWHRLFALKNLRVGSGADPNSVSVRAKKARCGERDAAAERKATAARSCVAKENKSRSARAGKQLSPAVGSRERELVLKASAPRAGLRGPHAGTCPPARAAASPVSR